MSVDRRQFFKRPTVPIERMGEALRVGIDIDRRSCLAWQDVVCVTCSDA